MADTGFATAQDRNAVQQRALLASIAEAGSAGAQAYTQAQQENQQLQQVALAQAGGGAPGPTSGSLAVNQGALAAGKASFEADIARQQTANASYMSQLGAAIPISEARSKLGIEGIMAKTAQDKADRDLQLQQSQLQLQGQREQIAGQREAMAGAREARADAHRQAGADRSITPYQMAQLELAKADNKRADDQNAAKQKTMDDASRQAKQSAYLESLNARWGKDDGKGNIKSGESYKAVYDIVNGYLSVDEALSRYKTPAGKPLSREAIQGEVDRINGIR